MTFAFLAFTLSMIAVSEEAPLSRWADEGALVPGLAVVGRGRLLARREWGEPEGMYSFTRMRDMIANTTTINPRTVVLSVSSICPCGWLSTHAGSKSYGNVATRGNENDP
jgi:hypothetical protein